MRIYTTPKTETPIVIKEDTSDKRIDLLEAKIARLAEEIARIKLVLESNARATRRQNTDINNLTTVLRNKNG